MPTRKAPAAKKSASARSSTAKAPSAKKAARNAAIEGAPVAQVFRSKVSLAALADGAKNIKQLARAVEKLAGQLAKMEAAGVTLEVPVARGTAHLSTNDTKLARRFGLEAGRAPRTAKRAASAGASASAAPSAQRPAAKKARAVASEAVAPGKTPAAAKKPARQRKASMPGQPGNAPVQTPAADAIETTSA